MKLESTTEPDINQHGSHYDCNSHNGDQHKPTQLQVLIEYKYSLKITEKSDMHSYGVVLLQILTGKDPTDNRIPDVVHIITWVNRELRERKREFAIVIDQQLLMRSSTQIQEMLQVQWVALLCVNPCLEERPTMKDVTTLLKEIRHDNDDFEKPNSLGRERSSNKSKSNSSLF